MKKFKIFLKDGQSGELSNQLIDAASFQDAVTMTSDIDGFECLGVLATDQLQHQQTMDESTYSLYHEDTISDWRLSDGSSEDVPLDHQKEYSRVIQLSTNTGGLYLDLSQKSDDEEDDAGLGDDMSLVAEIRNGKPAVSLGRGDQLSVHIESTDDGLFIHTDSDDQRISSATLTSNSHGNMVFKGTLYEI